VKTYTFKLVITEGSDEFWESLEGKSGADEVYSAILDCLDSQGWIKDKNQLTLQKYEDTKDEE
jgi:hypothetical protein